MVYFFSFFASFPSCFTPFLLCGCPDMFPPSTFRLVPQIEKLWFLSVFSFWGAPFCLSFFFGERWTFLFPSPPQLFFLKDNILFFFSYSRRCVPPFESLSHSFFAGWHALEALPQSFHLSCIENRPPVFPPFLSCPLGFVLKLSCHPAVFFRGCARQCCVMRFCFPSSPSLLIAALPGDLFFHFLGWRRSLLVCFFCSCVEKPFPGSRTQPLFPPQRVASRFALQIGVFFLLAPPFLVIFPRFAWSSRRRSFPCY